MTTLEGDERLVELGDEEGEEGEDEDEQDGEDEEETSGNYNCAQCPGQAFPDWKQLDWHKRKYHETRGFPCPVMFCNTTLTTNLGLRKHFTQAHRPKKHGCTRCTKRFTSAKSTRLHEVLHDTQWMCGYCEQFRATKELLEKHQNSHDPVDLERGVPRSRRYFYDEDINPEKPYMCLYDGCFKSFAAVHYVIKHVKGVHEGIPVQCQLPGCLKVLKNESTYKYHLKLHNRDGKTKDHICPDCGNGFGRIYELKRHQKSYCTPKRQVEKNNAEDGSAYGETSGPLPSVSLEDGEDTGDDSMEPSSADESPEDPISVPAFFSDVARARLQSILTDVLALVEGAHLARLPQSPSPASTLILGSNLMGFRDAQRIEPLLKLEARSLNTDTAATLSQFIVSNDPFRQLSRKLLVNQGLVVAFNIINPKHQSDSKSFRIEDGDSLDKKSWQVVGSHLQDICCRVPTTLSLLSDAHASWCLSAAKVLAFSKSSHIQIRLRRPTPSTTTRRTVYGRPAESYKVIVRGYNVKKGQVWSSNLYVPVYPTKTQDPILLPANDRITWLGDDLRHDPSPQLTAEDHATSYELAQYLVFRYYGYIGSVESCSNDYVRYTNDYWASITSHHTAKQPEWVADVKHWKGDPFFTTREHQGATILTPTQEFLFGMEGGGVSITLLSTGAENIFPVADNMLRALEAGHNHDVVWGVGCRQADFENHDIQVTPLVNIKGSEFKALRSKEFCAECVKLVKFDDLQLSHGYRDYAVCSACRTQWNQDVSNVRSIGGALPASILQHLRKENVVAGTGKTESQLKEEAKAVMTHLDTNFRKSASEYIDVYANQDLSLCYQRFETWDGCLLNPLRPSIEAVDPATVGPNGKTAYHVLSNMMITADALNRLKRHFPAAVLHIILVFLNACQSADEGLFDNGIAMIRMYIRNHYTYSLIGRAQQKFRVGRELPSNMADIQSSFRTPKLLEFTTSDQEAYRYLSQRRSISPKNRRTWKHPHHDFLYNQIELALKDVCDDVDEVEELRPFIFRKDSAGNMVLFPFLRHYSVVDDFTNWDLFELLSVRAIRNVTKCQLPHTRAAPLPQYGPDKLFLTIGHLWLRMVKKDKDAGIPKFAWGRDDCGLCPMPTINSGFCASLGHHQPGKIEHFGLEGVTYENEIDYTSSELIKFDLDKCNMRWETQFTNTLKYKYNFNSLEQTVLPQVTKIRLTESTGTINVLPDKYYREYTTNTEGLRDPWSDSGTPVAGSPDSFGFGELDQETAREMQNLIDEMELAVRGGTEHPRTSAQQIREVPSQPNSEIVSTRRNMTNVENSCYISVVVQMFANIAEFMYCLQQRKAIRPMTGRPTSLLANLKDPEGKKHERICDRLGELTSQLRGPDLTGSKLPPETTITFRSLLSDLKSDWGTQDVLDTRHESASFMMWLLSVINIVQDRSVYLDKSSVWLLNENGVWNEHSPWTEEAIQNYRHQQSVERQEVPLPLQVHCLEHWQAHLASGHDSIVTQISTIQVVQFEECDDVQCLSTLRSIDYPEQLIFILKDARHDGIQYDPEQSIPLSCLPALFVEDTHIERPRKCISKKHRKQDTPGRYTRITKRIARAPPILVVEINRGIGIDVDETNTGQEQFMMNRISEYNELNMSWFTSAAPELKVKTVNGVEQRQHEQLDSEELDRKYMLIGIIAWHVEAAHYTAFAFSEDNQWIYLDDTQEKVYYRNPFTDWPDQFVEAMLFYRNDLSAAEHIHAIRQEMARLRAPREASTQGPPVQQLTPPATFVARAETVESDDIEGLEKRIAELQAKLAEYKSKDKVKSEQKDKPVQGDSDRSIPGQPFRSVSDDKVSVPVTLSADQPELEIIEIHSSSSSEPPIDHSRRRKLAKRMSQPLRSVGSALGLIRDKRPLSPNNEVSDLKRTKLVSVDIPNIASIIGIAQDQDGTARVLFDPTRSSSSRIAAPNTTLPSASGPQALPTATTGTGSGAPRPRNSQVTLLQPRSSKATIQSSLNQSFTTAGAATLVLGTSPAATTTPTTFVPAQNPGAGAAKSRTRTVQATLKKAIPRRVQSTYHTTLDRFVTRSTPNLLSSSRYAAKTTPSPEPEDKNKDKGDKQDNDDDDEMLI